MIVANDRLENQLQDIRQENSGHLRLGISVQRGMRILPLAMPKFIARYPNVSLELRETGSVRMEDLLRYGEIDLAFAALESTSARFDYKLIEKETTGILVGRSSKLAERFESGTAIPLKEAKNEQFVSLKQGHSIRVVQDQLFRMLDIDPKILMEVDSLEMAKRVYFDETVIKKGVFYPLKGVENHRHFYACWRKGENLPRYAEDLIEIVTDVLDGRRAWEI